MTIEFIHGAFFGFGCFFMGIYVGWKAREIAAKKFLEVTKAKAKEHIESAYAKMRMPISIEKTDGILFVYSAEDGSFLAQGSTVGEVTDILNERFPGKVFVARDEDMIKAGLR